MNHRGSVSQYRTSCRSDICDDQLGSVLPKLTRVLTLLQSPVGCLQMRRERVSTSRRAGLVGCTGGRRWPVPLDQYDCLSIKSMAEWTYPVDKVGDSFSPVRHGCCRRCGTKVVGILHKDSHKQYSSSEEHNRRQTKSHTGY